MEVVEQEDERTDTGVLEQTKRFVTARQDPGFCRESREECSRNLEHSETLFGVSTKERDTSEKNK